VIQDMNSRATRADIAAEVAAMGVSRANAAFVRFTLSWLRRRAHTPEQFRELARRSAFGGAEVRAEGLGLEVRLRP
jgi:hypothetical protein